MFSDTQEKYIKLHLSLNNIILFTGSGFSVLAQNALKEPLPTGSGFSSKLWKFLGYNGDWDGTQLQNLYEIFLQRGISRNSKMEFLESNLMGETIPEIYKNLAIPYWFKIYTTNVDNVIDYSYKSQNKNFDNLIYPEHDFKERDWSLEKTQVVYLNGKLPCIPEDLIFSITQYAKSSNEHQPLYWHFVHEYITKPVIFIGTSLNEPLLEQYIQAREKKVASAEFRPLSFVILPEISPAKEELLKNQYNVQFIKGDAQTFLKWIESIKSELPSKEDVLTKVYPSLPEVTRLVHKTSFSSKFLNEFASSLRPVSRDYKVKQERSGYLLGNTPKWNDIYRNLDAPRKVTSEVLNFINESIRDYDELEFIALTGSGGSGKSTILKRLGLTLSLDGRTVFISNSEYLPKAETIVDILSSIKERCTLIFDNAENIFSQIPILLEKLQVLDYAPIIVVAVRTNTFERLSSKIPAVINVKEVQIPNLDKEEIIDLLEILEKNNLLDRLRGMTQENRIKEFEYRAKKQILVSMREATKGKSFDDIIRSEYEGIDNEDAKHLCLCISLITEQGFTVSEQDVVGFSTVNPSITLANINRSLAGIVLKVGPLSDRYIIRHKIIAEYFTAHCENVDLLKDAYIRVLSVLSAELMNSKNHSRKFNLYKELINHKKMYKRFKEDINQARYIYDSISNAFSYDSQFWLQYGSLESEGNGGNLELAENYINQAESLDNENYYIQNAKGNLLFKKALEADNLVMANEYKSEAERILLKTISTHGFKDAYCYYIFCARYYDWIIAFIKERTLKNKELERLLKIAKKGMEYHPKNKRFQDLATVINKAYLNTGVNANVEDPTYIDYEE